MSGTKKHIDKEIQYDRELESNINSILPKEIFIYSILKHLDLKGLYSFSLTCKKWSEYVSSYFETKGDFFIEPNLYTL